MTGFTIQLEGEGETADKLQKLYARTLPAGLHESIAKAVADKVREHLKMRDSTHPNILGGKRSHFYWHAAESVTSEATSEGAVVTIDHLGLRQRWLGGDIYPVHAKLLAIPARSEAYGLSPREFPGDLTFIKFRSGAMALVKDDTTTTTNEGGGYTILSAARGERRSRKRGIGLVEYWLTDHVYQYPDPEVLPSAQEVTEAATEAVGEYFAANE